MTQASLAVSEAASSPPTLRYYARQPILNAQGAVYAYELLFRQGPEAEFRGDGDEATKAMLDNTVVYGLDRLTGGLPAFVNCTREALTSRLVEVLPPSLTVLEILETVEPTPELLTACERLKDRGFALALDDFIWRPDYEPFVEIADYIKVDFALSDSNQRRALMKRIKSKRLKMLAEKVQTREEFEQACAEGFTLFQGYYFCKPALVQKSDIPANKITQLELLRSLQTGNFDLRRVSQLVERDPAIAYRLLRLVNSPMFIYRQEVRSVEEALIVVGENAFRRIATLAIAGSFAADNPAEVLRMAFIRARFCELAAHSAGFDPTEQYLLGMFSLLPAMLRIPMDQAISSLALREPIHAALLGETIPERSLLSWIEASESGDWQKCDTIQQHIRVDEAKLSGWAAEAVTWAEATLRGAI